MRYGPTSPSLPIPKPSSTAPAIPVAAFVAYAKSVMPAAHRRNMIIEMVGAWKRSSSHPVSNRPTMPAAPRHESAIAVSAPLTPRSLSKAARCEMTPLAPNAPSRIVAQRIQNVRVLKTLRTDILACISATLACLPGMFRMKSAVSGNPTSASRPSVRYPARHPWR